VRGSFRRVNGQSQSHCYTLLVAARTRVFMTAMLSVLLGTYPTMRYNCAAAWPSTAFRIVAAHIAVRSSGIRVYSDDPSECLP
jgi:hypothetical protein